MKRRTVIALPLALAACKTEPKVDLTKAPDTPPLEPYKLPAIYETNLSNGLAVTLVEDKRFPLVTARLGFRAGSRFDPPGRYGLSETVASLLKEGTTTRSARQIADELGRIGGELGASADADSLIVSSNALSEHMTEMLDLMADVAKNASFPQEELDLRKQNRLQELELELSQSQTLADVQLHKSIFGAHPYGFTLPTPAAIKSIQRADLTAYRDKLLVAGGAILVVVGNIGSREKAMELIQAKFGSWPKAEPPAPPASTLPEPKKSIVLIDRPGSAQVDLLVGHLGLKRSDPEYFPLLVGSTILGGGANSRMFINIREKQGFAYHASSHHAPMKETGVFTAVTQVREEVLEKAIQAVLDEIGNMGKAPVTAEELSDVKNYLNGTFVMRIANQNGLADQLAGLKLNGMSTEYLEQYVTRVRAVTPEQIQKAMAKFADPATSAVAVVGDASKILKTVEKFGPVKVEKAA